MASSGKPRVPRQPPESATAGEAYEALVVVDDESGKVLYQLYLYGYGSGVLFDHQGRRA
jgi:hypothetical protein